MVNVSILLLALALVAVAISVIILDKRVTALEKEFACSSVKSLEAANKLQIFSQEHLPVFIAGDNVNPLDRVSSDSYFDVNLEVHD